MTSLTRRQALLGAAAVSAGGFGLWGRYAIGGTFESHVAAQLGLPEDVTGKLLETLRGELGLDYDARASAFLVATTSPSRLAMPREARREAIESLLGPLMKMQDGFVTPYVLAGVRNTGSYAPCLLRRDEPARS